MLPVPISSRRPPYRKPGYANNKTRDIWLHRLHHLSARSRITNLAVLLLSASLILSLLLNIRHWLEDEHNSFRTRNNFGKELPGSIKNTIERPLELQKLEHLIIVPGHSVWSGSTAEDATAEEKWSLERHQSGQGARSRIRAFINHIQSGVNLADADPKSLLVFSGGATRAPTPDTESASYLSLAIALSLLNPEEHHVKGLSTYERSVTEDYALDSFQNLLFSLARFRTVTGHYPTKITVVGYAMKEARFTKLHRLALRWPERMWNYVGIHIEEPTLREEAMRGERANGYEPYLRDLYGCHDMLLAKRRARNVHRKVHPYHMSAPEIAPLLEWCPRSDPSRRIAQEGQAEVELGDRNTMGETFTHIFEGSLPWNSL